MFKSIYEYFFGEWETVCKMEGTCNVGNPFTMHYYESDAIVVVQKHSKTERIRAYYQIPSGTYGWFGSDYAEYLYEKYVDKNLLTFDSNNNL